MKHCWSCVAAVALCLLGWTAVYLSGARIYQEGGWMENQQALCLALAAVAFACASRFLRSFRPEKLFYASLSLFCVTFLLRELELHRSVTPGSPVEWLFVSRTRNIVLGIVWLLLGLIARSEVRAIWRAFRTWIGSPAGRTMLVAGTFYAATWPFDKEFIPLAKPLILFVEELGDSTATVLILMSAAATVLAVRQQRPEPRATPRPAGERVSV